MRKCLLYAESPEWADFLEQADAVMGSPNFRPVKNEARTRAGFVSTPEGGCAFLKRSEVSSLASGLADRFRGSRAARALRGAEILHGAGFLCPRPLAAMDVIDKGALCRGYLLSEALENAQILSHYALGRRGAVRHGYCRRKTVSDALAREIRRLHDAGIYTRDLQETNLMVEQREDVLRFYFLDLEDFRRVRHVSRRRRMLNLVHLDRSIGRFICRAGRLNFLYAYEGGDLTRDARRRLLAEYMAVRQSVERGRRRFWSIDAPAQSGARA